MRCAQAHLDARLGRTAEARRTLAELARDDFAALPFDQEWLYGASLLAETAALVGDADAAASLYRLLAPWASLNAGDHPEGIRGSVSRYLGILATATERWEAAEGHYEDALGANDAMGFRPWSARTREDHARMLSARGRSHDQARARALLADALATYRALGLEPGAQPRP